jgi:type IV pilus assembly protein PilW
MSTSRARASRGMTLVELMIGMTVGLFVVLVAIAIFVSTRTLNMVGSASTRMSENARLAMDLLQGDIRNAGFAGCRPLLNDAPVIVLLAGDGGFLATSAGMGG